jgi:hypothetical protein
LAETPTASRMAAKAERLAIRIAANWRAVGDVA